MKNRKKIDMEFIYSEMKGEVRAADAKLGIMISSMSLLITAISIVLNSIEVDWKWILIAISPFVIQTIIAIIGIFPYSGKYNGHKKQNERKNKTNSQYENNYYFKFISSFQNSEKYLEYLKANFESINDIDLINQIYTNAYIANRKYSFYQWSWIFFSWPFKIARKLTISSK